MKKLLEKDKNRRRAIKKSEKQYCILKSIYKNMNFNVLVRWNAFFKLKNLTGVGNSEFSLLDRCLCTINKKKYHKLTNFSRYIFLKLIRSNQIYGLRKSSW